MPQLQKIITHLCFPGHAEEAANFYVSVFADSRVVNVLRTFESGTDPRGTVMAVTFQLEGQEFMAMNGGADTGFSPAMSLFVKCELQEEIDRLWTKLLDGGQALQSGWLKDRYGLTWQIVPTLLGEMIHDGDAQKVARVLAVVNKMVKLEIAPLKAAFNS